MGWNRLRPYQQRTARALAEGPYVGLWLCTGSGKTATALSAWSFDPELPMLVVTKALGRHVWGRDGRWVLGENPRFGVLWGGKEYSKTGVHRDGTYTSLDAALESCQVIVTNYEVLVKREAELLGVPWRYLVFDEAHALKQGYQRPKRLMSSRQVKRRRFEAAVSLARIVQARGGRVWEITATPVPDRLRDLWAQLHIALPKETLPFLPPWGSPEHTWAESSWGGRFCALTRGYNDSLDSSGRSNLEELNEYLRGRFLKLRRADIAAELPPISRDVRTVSPVVDRRHMGGGVEEALARAATAKLPEAAELACEYLAGGDKVVLTVNRRELNGQVLEAVLKEARSSVPRGLREKLWSRAVTGETEIRARVEVTREFQIHQGPAVLCATIESITEAIDLHQAAGLIFVALPITPRQVEQVEGRVGRLGGVPCTVTYLVAEDTIDERIRTLILDKLDGVYESGTDSGGEARVALHGMRDPEEILAELRTWLAEEGSQR